jgi:hypothetical protein
VMSSGVGTSRPNHPKGASVINPRRPQFGWSGKRPAPDRQRGLSVVFDDAG